ncbi:MAG TPA: hypothetical protein ENI87_04965 [bacterium]|nr:hypothetical protein [bacterium]
MSRTVLAAALLFVSPVGLVAQSDEPARATQDPQAAYNELVRSFAKAVEAWQDELQAALKKQEEGGPRVPRKAYRPPTKSFIATAQEHAQELAGRDEAVMFLGFILKNASSERNAIKWAVKTLNSDHADSAAIADVVDYLPMAATKGAGRNATKLLGRIAEQHGDAEVRAKALLARAAFKTERGDSSGAIADLKAVQSVSKDEDLLAEAKDLLAEVQKFAIGAVAPEIEGVDTDGVAFKLSDYRGKVVLLDFWGFW